MIKEYFRLTKPGIVRGNLITAIAGFFFASRGSFDPVLFITLVFGISFIIASACVFNNYIDRKVDARMSRTRKRAMVTKAISVPRALTFGFTLGVLGFAAIALFINTVTLVLGLIAYVTYIFIYGLAKRKSMHGTLVGTIPGALPLTAGYTAVTGAVDSLAITLFMIMVFWQMPHFYAIAIFRLKDYKSAGIPVMPAVKGIFVTKVWMLIYILLFFFTVLYFYFAANLSIFYLAGMIIAGIFWLRLSTKGFRTKNDNKWAVGMFSVSLRVLLVFSLLISLDSFLPLAVQ